jgi:hypothetical protein
LRKFCAKVLREFFGFLTLLPLSTRTQPLSKAKLRSLEPKVRAGQGCSTGSCRFDLQIAEESFHRLAQLRISLPQNAHVVDLGVKDPVLGAVRCSLSVRMNRSMTPLQLGSPDGVNVIPNQSPR